MRIKRKKHQEKLAFIDTNKKSCAFFLKWFREQRKLTTRECAELLGVSQSLISQVEGGRHALPLHLMKEVYKEGTANEKKFLLECIYADIDSFITF